MHLKSLKVFCDVVGRRSFSRAASENGISQSGASQIVNALEEHLGVKLIDRTKRPFVLTPEGEVYYEGCRKLVQRYFALEEEVKTLHEEVAGKVSVASIYSIGLSHMNRFVQRPTSRQPRGMSQPIRPGLPGAQPFAIRRQPPKGGFAHVARGFIRRAMLGLRMMLILLMFISRRPGLAGA